MSLRGWLKSLLIADPAMSAVYAAIDQDLSRNEPWRLDTLDGVFAGLPCWKRSPEGWTCCLQPHPDDHMAWDGDGNLVAVWGDDQP